MTTNKTSDITEADFKERIDYACNHIIVNDNVIKSNLTKWDSYKDNMLKQLVIVLNFNFAEIAKRFDKLCGINHTKPNQEPTYNETELRRHYAFLYSMRHLNNSVGNDYYHQLHDKENHQP